LILRYFKIINAETVKSANKNGCCITNSHRGDLWI